MNIKICLVGSSGGHLTHLYMLKPVVSSFSASRIRKNSMLNPMRPAGVLDGFRLI